VRHDVHNVFLARRGVNVILSELVDADNVRHSPRLPVPSKKLVGVAFSVAWHVVQEHNGFKPAKFVHQVNYESPERAVIIARAAISY